MSDGCGEKARKDWAGNWVTLVALWGLPAGIMVASTLLESGIRAGAWTVALAWMAMACLINA